MSFNVVITGASRGIGYETSLYLAEEGHEVTAVARSKDRLHTLQQKSEHIIAYPADLTRNQDIQQLANTLQQQHSSVDVLINCAGALVNKPFEELTDEDWQKMLDVNLLAPVRLIRTLLPIFSDGGHILNISSMAGYQGSSKFPGLAAYSAAKGALSILTECLSAELGEHNLSCNALCLGMVQTEMLEEAFPGIEAPVSASSMGRYVGNFSVNGHQLYNGQVLPVNRKDPS